MAAGIYDLVMRISREYNQPIIEITESGCGYLDAPYDRRRQVPDARRIEFFREELAELARAIADGATSPRRSTPGACSTTSSGPMDIPSAMV